MQLPTLQTGAAAWKAGHEAIQGGAFTFQQTAEDNAYRDLKHYAGETAKKYFIETYRDSLFTPEEHLRLYMIFVRIFIDGAFDQIMMRSSADAS
jgi:hypothetical protein